jgi:hypothetical protein
MKRITNIAAAFGLLIAFGVAGHFDVQDEQVQHEHYCEMVAIWEADAARGVPSNDRAGWPPFDGECKQ